MSEGHHGPISTIAAVLLTVFLSSGPVAYAQAPAANGPFADAVARSVIAVFDTTREVTLHGVITMPMTQINRAGASYFTMTVKGDAGAPATWAVFVRRPDPQSKLQAGAGVTVTGWTARDGSRRIESYADRIRVAP
jgi:hypothetical protein